MKESKGSSQKRRTETERAELIQRFQQSGLTRVAFARQNGIAFSTLDYWLARERYRSRPGAAAENGQEKAPSSPAFREIQLSSLLSLPSAVWAVELVTSTGLTIRCRQALSIAELERLVRC